MKIFAAVAALGVAVGAASCGPSTECKGISAEAAIHQARSTEDQQELAGLEVVAVRTGSDANGYAAAVGFNCGQSCGDRELRTALISEDCYVSWTGG
jgi:hypothetical protein